MVDEKDEPSIRYFNLQVKKLENFKNSLIIEVINKLSYKTSLYIADKTILTII
jgi:hypothetical protein